MVSSNAKQTAVHPETGATPGDMCDLGPNVLQRHMPCPGVDAMIDGALAPPGLDQVWAPSTPAASAAMALRPSGALFDQVRETAEEHLANLASGSISQIDLLRTEAIGVLLQDISDTLEQIQILREAVGLSNVIELRGSRVVMSAQATDLSAEPGIQGTRAEAMGADLLGYHLGRWPSNEHPGFPAPEDYSLASYPPYEQLNEDWPRSSPHDRREWICAVVRKVLEHPPLEVAKCTESDGFVSVDEILRARPSFSQRLFGKPALVLRAILGSRQYRIAVDTERSMVRLLSAQEQVKAIAEDMLAYSPGVMGTPLRELLSHTDIKDVVVRSLDGSESPVTIEFLEDALKGSNLVQAKRDSTGEPKIEARPRWGPLLEAVEAILDSDPRARSIMSSEGEIPLPWMLEQAMVIKALERAAVPAGEHALEELRIAIGKSNNYDLDVARMSVRSVTRNKIAFRKFDAEEDMMRRHGSCVPLEKNVKQLRELLAFYFDLFNMQHNRVLMSRIEAQRNKCASEGVGYLRREGARPVFLLSELLDLPRIAKLFEQYDRAAWPCLVASAIQTGGSLPVRIHPVRKPGAPRGAWANNDIKIELTYVPSLRFVEILRRCPEVRPLVEPDINPHAMSRPFAPNAICVISYSLSSDLSHSQSPKAADVLDAVVSGGLDPAAMTWASRQQKIRRQLLLFSPDIICVQGLQSIGFAERCSEMDPTWFACNDEPESNHLVHLYRLLSKYNYGVTFSPTMKLPGSAVVCFGNAIFWKRSRWQLDRAWGASNVAACAELRSRHAGLHVVVCSAKSAAGFARDWGDAISDAELAGGMTPAHDALSKSGKEARMIWCGDFGCDFKSFCSGLLAQGHEPMPKWRSVCESVLQQDAWTSASKHTEGKVVDLILHTSDLEALATLGGLPESNQISLLDMLKMGYPSDHLMQLALFIDAQGFQ